MTTVSVPQHVEALELANRIRLARAQAKRDLRAGRLTVAAALDLEEMQSMPVFELLKALPRWGKCRALKTLRDVPCGDRRRVGELTDRQRARLLELVA